MDASSPRPRLILGSSSKWRRQAFGKLGLPFETAAPEIDEAAVFEACLEEGQPVQAIATEIALCKLRRLMSEHPGERVLIVAGDQLSEFRGEPRGKPKDAGQARAWLRGYRGVEVVLISAVAVGCPLSGAAPYDVDTAVVAFGDLPDEAIENAIRSGEVLESCGAVVHEHPAIAPHVRFIRGTAESVAGMPLDVVTRLLKLHGYRFPA